MLLAFLPLRPWCWTVNGCSTPIGRLGRIDVVFHPEPQVFISLTIKVTLPFKEEFSRRLERYLTLPHPWYFLLEPSSYPGSISHFKSPFLSFPLGVVGRGVGVPPCTYKTSTCFPSSLIPVPSRGPVGGTSPRLLSGCTSGVVLKIGL